MPDVRIQLVGADSYRTLTHGFTKGQTYSVPQHVWEEKFSKVRGPLGQRLFAAEGEALISEQEDLQAAVGLTPNRDEPVPNIQTVAELLAGGDPVDQVPDGAEVTTVTETDTAVQAVETATGVLVDTTAGEELPQGIPDPEPEPEVPETSEVGGDQTPTGEPAKAARRISVSGGKTTAVKV